MFLVRSCMQKLWGLKLTIQYSLLLIGLPTFWNWVYVILIEFVCYIVLNSEALQRSTHIKIVMFVMKWGGGGLEEHATSWSRRALIKHNNSLDMHILSCGWVSSYENCTKNDTCLNYVGQELQVIGLHAQMMLSTLHSIVNVIGRTYKERRCYSIRFSWMKTYSPIIFTWWNSCCTSTSMMKHNWIGISTPLI